ncbi:MAG TPA: hypothetical protein VLM40_03395, partial [Gemmata sp.]|nr:hypothetical protein [Gemmata sp.]
VRDALRAAFQQSGIALSVVALPVPPAEAAAQAEFKEVVKITPSGLFVPVDRVNELAEWVRNRVNPRLRFTLATASGVGIDLTAGSDTADIWHTGQLQAGTYQLRVSGAKDFAQDVQLFPGDRLLLDLAEDRGTVTATRHWWADTAAGTKAGKSGDGWRLNLMQNRAAGGGLRLFAAIEERPSTSKVLAVSRIGDVWFELKPVIPSAPAIAARWRAAAGYPAPAWSIDVPGWPAFPGTKSPASPIVEVWWNQDGPFPAVGTWALPEGETLLSRSPRDAKVGDIAMTIESVTSEEHAVDPGIAGRREGKKCLVVRLSHAPGTTVWVRPVGGQPSGSEVRVYRKANRVTCVFWGLEPSKVTGFEVVSLNEVLKQAEARGCHAKLENIPGPTDTSSRAEPPVDVR